MNQGVGGCSELRSRHCTLAWQQRETLSLKKKKKELEIASYLKKKMQRLLSCKICSLIPPEFAPALPLRARPITRVKSKPNLARDAKLASVEKNYTLKETLVLSRNY